MEDCYRQHMEDRDHVAEFSTSLCEDIFDLTSLFSTTQTDQSGLPFDNSTLAGKKRPRGSDDGDVEAPQGYFGENEDLEAFRLLVPELFPHCPSLDNRRPVNFIENPFFEDHLAIVERHPHLRPTSQMNTGVVINGYLKFVVRSSRYDGTRDFGQETHLARQVGICHRHNSFVPPPSSDHVSRLPPGFGSSAKIDPFDQRILKFYTLAICGGRTLLPKTNAWLDLGSVIDSHECARHAALAFSAGYMLDYIPSERLRIRANFHYKRASELLALALNDLNIYQVGKEDGVITALHLLWSDDIVQWELREPKTVRPRWRRGTRTATAILDATDPGYRYWKPENVQITSIRRSNANMCAYAEICALPVTRLFVTEIDKLYPWLLEGSEEDVRQIHGGTGVSPKVLHIYAQITQLSARIAELPDSPILPHAADALMRRLENFRQTSELSRGHETTAQLLESCILDERGLVHCATKVTELTAETWVQAAKIYLCCRFFRMPRYHSEVRQHLSCLLQCVERMPTEGDLFTAQSPFFCIFMSALVAYQHEHRRVIRQWFDSVVSTASGRSSVPPIYNIIKIFWNWIDMQPFATEQESFGHAIPLEERTPWWEIMVEWLLENYGELSLV